MVFNGLQLDSEFISDIAHDEGLKAGLITALEVHAPEGSMSGVGESQFDRMRASLHRLAVSCCKAMIDEGYIEYRVGPSLSHSAKYERVQHHRVGPLYVTLPSIPDPEKARVPLLWQDEQQGLVGPLASTIDEYESVVSRNDAPWAENLQRLAISRLLSDSAKTTGVG